MVIVLAQRQASHPYLEDPVLLNEARDDIGLVSACQARERHEQELERVGVGQHRPVLLRLKRPHSGPIERGRIIGLHGQSSCLARTPFHTVLRT